MYKKELSAPEQYSQTPCSFCSTQPLRAIQLQRKRTATCTMQTVLSPQMLTSFAQGASPLRPSCLHISTSCIPGLYLFVDRVKIPFIPPASVDGERANCVCARVPFFRSGGAHRFASSDRLLHFRKAEWRVRQGGVLLVVRSGGQNHDNIFPFCIGCHAIGAHYPVNTSSSLYSSPTKLPNKPTD